MRLKSSLAVAGLATVLAATLALTGCSGSGSSGGSDAAGTGTPVSYTHLTLPTKCSV